jgi:hypothetical protein
MGLFDIALSFWLVFKGLGPSGTAEPDTGSGRAQAGIALTNYLGKHDGP